MKKHYIPLMLAFLFALTSFAQTPSTSAPNPAEDPADVVSIYSDTYTDLAIANYDPNWGQSGHTLVNTTFDPTGAGTDFVLAYPNFNYQGTDFGSNEDLSGMDFLHVDIWVDASVTNRMVKVSPISNGAGPVEVLVEVPLTPGSWNSVTLDKADFTGMPWDSIYQLKFDGQFNADGTANTTPYDIYLDNIYFSQTPATAPSNDDCVAAETLTVNSDFGCGITTAGTIALATDSGEDNCSGTEDDDVWYSFVATDTTHKVDLLNITGGTSDLYHVVYDGTSGCGSLGAALTCSDPNSSLTSGLTIGDTYYVQVYSWTSTPGQSSSFDICIGTPPPPPANDNLCDAIPLAVDASSTGDQYTNNSATAQANEPLPGCFSNGILGSVWFTFDAPASGEVTVTTDIAGGTLDDTEVAVYDAPTDCTDLTTLGAELGCDQDGGSLVNFNSIVDLTGLTPGATYYVQVDSWSSSATGTFGINVLDANPPPPGPTVSAPVPTEDASNVVSVFSDTYTDLPIGNYDPNWGQSGHTLVNTMFDPTGAGTDFVLAYPNFNYQGTDFGSNEDLSGMDFLHVDIWVEAGTDRMVKVSPISNGAGPVEVLVEVPLTPGSWNSVALAKADFVGMGWESIYQLKFDGQFNGDGTANTTPFDVYVDNIYFSQTPPVTGTTLAGPFLVDNPNNNPVTVNVNDAVNSAGFSPLLYDSFEITVDWVNDNNAWSSEADMDVLTTGGNTFINPPTSGGAGNGNSTTLTFEGDFPVLYDPATDGSLDLVLNQSFDASSANWTNITVTLFEAPSCPDLTGLAVSSAGPDSATLNWDDSALATDGYTWSVYTSPSDPSTDTAVATGTVAGGITTAQATGLSPQTDYDFYLVANCGAANGSSALAGPVAFTTACSVFAAPYTEDFENSGAVPNCWTLGGDEDWLFNTSGPNQVGDGGTLSGSTLSGGYYAVVDDSGTGTLNAQLDSPFVDLSSLTTPALSFYQIRFTDTDPNAILSVSIWDGAAWNLVGTFDTDTNGWEEVLIDISGLTFTGPAQVRFSVEDSGSFYDDVAIDDVSLKEAPSCFAPTNLVAANISSSGLDLSWDAAASEVNGYEWVVMNSGDAPDVATAAATGVVGTGVLTTNVSGLPASSSFDAYVRTDCGGDGISAWSAILSFDTLCDTFLAPFSEDFSSLALPNCWSQPATNQEDWEFDDDPSGTNIGDDGDPFITSTPSGGGFAWVDDSNSPEGINTRLESPFIDISGLTVPAVSFYFISNNQGDTNVDFKVEVWDGAAWNQVFFSNQNTVDGGWQEVIVDISGLTFTGDIQVAFVVDENLVDGDFNDDIAIDDVSVDEAPACLKPLNLTASNILLTTADVSWDPINSATNGYLWSLFAAGDDPLVDTPLDSGTTDAVTTSVSLSGLTEATDYEFYVESDCDTDGTSGLSAPLGFSTLTPGLDCGVPLSATVTPFGDNSQPIIFDTTDIPDMSSVPSCEGTDSTEQGFWYEFTTNSTAGVTLNLLAGDAGDIEGAIYDSCGGTELFCFADGNSQDFTSDVLVTGLTPSTTYILQVFSESFNEGAFELSITDLPACPQPLNLSTSGVTFDSAQLNWDEEPNASLGYIWEVYTSPSDVTTDTPVDSGTVAFGTNFATVTGLMAETDYDFYVTADCDADGSSAQSGPVTFTTGCAPFTPDYLEDFTTYVPNCWEEAGAGDPTTGPSDFGTSLWLHDQFLNATGSNNSVNINLYTDNREDWLISPIFDLSAGGYELSYIAAVTDFANGNVPELNGMGSDDEVQVLITEDGGLTWTSLRTYNQSDFPSETGDLEVIDLSAFTGNVRFAFWGTDGTVNDLEDYDFFIDEFQVRTPPPPANDNLCDAIPLTVGAPSAGDAYTNVAATAETGEPVATCFNDGINGSVWFTFDAPASGDVTVTTDIAGASLTDTEVAVYDAPTDCTDLTTLGTELGCDQDGGAIINFNSIVDLTGLTPGATYYVQVDQWGTAAPGTFGIRVLDNNPPCPDPTNLNVTNIGEDSATLNWDDIVEAITGYEWSVYLSPSDPAVDTPIASGTTGAGITTADVLGLMPQTDYDFYVLSDCDVDGQSILSEAVTFTTLCTAFVAPYIDGFETFDVTTDLVNQECWSEISPTGYDWEIDSNGTDSTGTGPNGPFLGSRYAVVDATDGANGDVATFQSPAVDVSGLTTPSLSFYYHMFGAFITQLDVEVSGDGGPFTNVLSLIGQQQTGNAEAWEIAVVDLSAYAGQTISVRFITSKSTQPGNTFEGDVAIDEIRIDELPTCNTPTGLTVSNVTLDSADLSWDDDASATNGYNWSIYSSPSDPLVDTPVATGSTAAGMTMTTATGLSTLTDYDFYLEADCGTDGTSVPAGPISFTTLPDFCAGDLFYDNGGPGANYTNNSNETTTISPSNPGDVVYVEFLSFDTENNYDGIQIYDGPDTSSPLIDSGFVNPGFGPLSNGTWTGTGVNSPQGVTFISTHPTGALTFVFTSDDIVTAPGWEATVTCALPPACPDPTGLTVSNITIDSADLSWNDNVTATNGYVWSVFASPSDPLVDTPIATGNTGVGVITATATGLSSATSYDFYLTADCDTGGTSNLVGPVTFSTTPDFCGGDLFYDNGGPGANYTDNSNETTTISPANPGDVVTVEFVSFDTELNWDGIQIYDGPDASAPLIDSGFIAPGFSPLINGTWTGDNTEPSSAEGVTFTSTHPTGALTFVFTSDASATRAGWEAVVTCAAPEILDYYNLQFPANGSITTGDSFSVFAQAYEAGLTDASDTPAAGIEAWIGYSTTDSSPDTATDWTWVLASTNPGFDFTQNNDEYQLDLGAELSAAGTYYYASRWSLNGGPFTYGGILPDASNGGEWGTGGFVSGVLTVSDPLPTPMTPAPDPTEDPSLVISLFSGVYTDVPVDSFFAFGPGTLTDIQIQGNDTKLYEGVDFLGIETLGANSIDASGMNKFHLDYWTPNMTTFRVKLVDFGPDNAFGGGDDTEDELTFDTLPVEAWNSLEIDLIDFVNLSNLQNISQIILSGLPVGQGVLYVDNIYFSTTTIGTTQFDSNNFSFYPNPANNELNLVTRGQVEQVKVYNMLGQQVIVETPNTVSPRLNVESLQSGTYIMNVTIDGASKNFKFVKE